jgi:hypothetical protein
MKPNFLVVGAFKSGSTWLYHCLQEHPEVFVSTPKEIHFFGYSVNYQKGDIWYESFFENVDSEKAIGELSMSYMSSDLAPSRIYQYNPKMRIIFILRNPIDRLYSHYRYFSWKYTNSPNFDWIDSDETHPLMNEGLYFKHISRFLELFPDNQVKILIHDDLQKDSESFLKSVYSFLNVDSTFQGDSLFTRRNESKFQPRLLQIYRPLKLIDDTLIGSRYISTSIGSLYFDLKQKFRSTKLFDFLYKTMKSDKSDFPELTFNQRKILSKYFESDVNALSTYLDRDLSCWLEL